MEEKLKRGRGEEVGREGGIRKEEANIEKGRRKRERRRRIKRGGWLRTRVEKGREVDRERHEYIPG